VRLDQPDHKEIPDLKVLLDLRVYQVLQLIPEPPVLKVLLDRPETKD
jgi:hypothetical protein